MFQVLSFRFQVRTERETSNLKQLKQKFYSAFNRKLLTTF